MFWRVTGLAQSSPVELILNKPEFTLEELLEEEDLIQECKSLNGKLINFLKQKEIVERLLKFVVEDPTHKPSSAPSSSISEESTSVELDTSSSVSESNENEEVMSSNNVVSHEDTARSFKFSFLACEIFCCEVDSIFNTILEHEELLSLLFKFLETQEVADSTDVSSDSRQTTDNINLKPTKLNTLLAGYFSRVAGCFILRYMPEFMQYLKGNLYIIDNLINHIENTSIAEVLMRLVGADEQTITYHADCVQWLSETNLLDQLLARVSTAGESQYSDREAINASEVLVAISRTAPSALATALSSPSSIQTLLRSIDCTGTACMTSSLTVILSVLDPRRSCMVTLAQNSGPVSHGMLSGPPILGGSSQQSQQQQQQQIEVNKIVDVEDAFISIIRDLVSLLDVTGDSNELEMSYDVLRPPLGQMRLRIVELLNMLFRTGGEKSLDALIETDTIAVLLKLFERYPFNNFLHSEVEYTICSILDLGHSKLISHLMDEVKLLSVLANLPTYIEAKKPASENIIKWMAGYNGHVTRICNEILNTSQRNEMIVKAMENNDSWKKFVNDVLVIRNNIEDVQRWKCGRPQRLEDNFIESDDDDMQQIHFEPVQSSTDDSNKSGLVGFSTNLLPGRYDTEDSNNEDAELSQILDDIDNEDDIYFADEGERSLGMSSETGIDSFNGSEGVSGSSFTQFAFHDDDAADDVVVVEGGDDVIEVNLENVMGPILAEAESESSQTRSESTSSMKSTTSYLDKLVSDMRKTSLGDDGDDNSSLANVTLDENEESEAPEFNTFNYWKPTYEVDIPDDV